MKRGASSESSDSASRPSKKPRRDSDFYKFVASADTVADFLTGWESYKDTITLFDLLEEIRDGKNKGTSALWMLAGAADQGMAEPFMAVWNQFKDELPLAALLAQVQEGDDKGKSALWLLAGAAAWGKPEPFMAVWNQFKDELPLAALLAQAQEGDDKGTSALWLLLDAAKKEDKQLPGPMTSILQNILFHKRGVIQSDLSEVKDLIELNIVTREFLQVRNDFFEMLTRFESQDIPATEGELKTLLALAKSAQEKGYVNASYDVGNYLISKQAYDKAFECYEKIPRESVHYETVCDKIASNRFVKAREEPADSFARIQHLHVALGFALKIQRDEVRMTRILEIAALYITNSKPPSLQEAPLVPMDWLEAMNESTSVEWCFKRFDEIKKTKLLENELKQSKLENQRLQKIIDAFLQRPFQDASQSPAILHAYTQAQVARADDPAEATTSVKVNPTH